MARRPGDESSADVSKSPAAPKRSCRQSEAVGGLLGGNQQEVFDFGGLHCFCSFGSAFGDFGAARWFGCRGGILNCLLSRLLDFSHRRRGLGRARLFQSRRRHVGTECPLRSFGSLSPLAPSPQRSNDSVEQNHKNLLAPQATGVAVNRRKTSPDQISLAGASYFP